MKKKFLLIIACLIMAVSQLSVSAQQSRTLSLEEAISMAKKDNPQFLSADTKIKDAEKQIAEAKRDQKNVKGAIRLPEGLASAAVKKGYYVEQAKIGLESAKLEKTQMENNLAYEVTQKYYGLKLAEALYENAQAAHDLAAANKSTVDSQFALGLAAEFDVNSAAYSVLQAEAGVKSYGRNKELARKSLLLSLQIDDEQTQLVLTDDIEYAQFSTNLSEDIKKAMETRFDVFSLKSVSEQAKRYLDVAKLMGYNSGEYSAANQSLVQSEYNYDNTKKLIALSIESSYNEILNAEDAYKLAEENLKLRKQEYDIAKLQYELGMITNSNLTAVMNSVNAAQIELENSKLTYKLAVEKYGYEITIGI